MYNSLLATVYVFLKKIIEFEAKPFTLIPVYTTHFIIEIKIWGVIEALKKKIKIAFGGMAILTQVIPQCG